MPALRRFAAALLLLAAPAAAQEAFPVSFDLSAGYGAGWGGSTIGQEGAVLDATLAFPLARSGASTLLAAVSAGVYGPLTTNEVCAVADPGPEGPWGCLPGFPVLGGAGLLAGVQRGSPRGAAVRLLAGASVFHSEDEVTAPGLQGRVDVDTPPFLHASAVLSVRALVLPGYRGETLRFVGVGLGLRLR